MANQNSKLRNKKQSAAASRAERRDTGADREQSGNASLSGMKRLGEAVFLIIFLLCVISLVSLGSHDINDPSWTQSRAADQTIGSIHNLVGFVGAYVSDFLLFCFGLASYVLPLAVLYLAACVFLRKYTLRSIDFFTVGLSLLGFVLMFTSVCCLLSMLDLRPYGSYSAGGVFGAAIASWVSGAMGTVGASLLFILIFAIGLPFLTGISWTVIADKTGGIVCGIFDYVSKIREERRQKAEERLAQLEKERAALAEQEKAAHEARMKQARAEAELRLQQEQAEAELRLEREKAEMQARIEREKAAIEAMKRGEAPAPGVQGGPAPDGPAPELSSDPLPYEGGSNEEERHGFFSSLFRGLRTGSSESSGNESDNEVRAEDQTESDPLFGDDPIMDHAEKMEPKSASVAGFTVTPAASDIPIPRAGEPSVPKVAPAAAPESMARGTASGPAPSVQPSAAPSGGISFESVSPAASRPQPSSGAGMRPASAPDPRPSYSVRDAAPESDESLLEREASFGFSPMTPEEQAMVDRPAAPYDRGSVPQPAVTRPETAGYTEIPRAGGLDAFREPDVRPAEPSAQGSAPQQTAPQGSGSGRLGGFGFDITPEDVAIAREAEERYRSSGLRNTPFAAEPEDSAGSDIPQPQQPAPAAVQPQPQQPAPAPVQPSSGLPMHHESPNSWGPIPGMDLLNPLTQQHQTISPDEIESLSRLVEEKLREFRITVQVVGADCGPVITLFKLQPEPGTKSSQITNISTDLARSLLAKSVRVLEIIPGTTYIGLEIPNRKRETVFFREVIDSEKFRSFHGLLPMALGVDVTGKPVVADLAEMPHLLVAGTTGSGKSVGVNTMIMSLLLSKTPDEVRFIMIDPKMLEFSSYNGIPHLLTPVVTDMKQASNALRWAVGEMERRYALMAKTGVKKLTEFNRKVEEARIAGTPLRDPTWQYTDSMDTEAPELTKLPFIVIVIDEFADMMMTVGKTVETLVARLAQKARAAGIHLVIATQSPRKNVLTGLIKTNIPSRLSFSVQSNMDSRIILDQGGAENLLGNGDMLFLPTGSQFPIRVHGAFVQNAEIERVTAEWRTRGEPEYVDGVTDDNPDVVLPGESGGSAGRSGSGGQDELFDRAVELVSRLGRVSCSILQRNFGIGYPRAASLIDELEEGGIVSEPRQNGRRDVLTRRQGE